MARWDASILELFGQCSPDACASALLDRAYKNELVAPLFHFRIRTEMSSIITRQGKKAVAHLPDIRLLDGYSHKTPTRGDAFAMAHELREAFYELNGVHTVNHTFPDYPACLAAVHHSSFCD